MTYRVLLSKQARRYFASLPPHTAQRLASVFEILEAAETPPNTKPLKGELQGLHRVRIGGLRLIYERNDNTREIRVVRIGRRGDVY